MSESLHDLYIKSVGSPCYKDFNFIVSEIYEKAKLRVLEGGNLPYVISIYHYNQDLALLNPALACKHGIIGSYKKVGSEIVYTIEKFVKVPTVEVDDIPEVIIQSNIRHKRWWG